MALSQKMHMGANEGPAAFHVLIKPAGAACNLNCKYCFYLSKKELYPESSLRMADAVLEQHVRQYLEAQRVPEATVAWQGGEPTLMGLDFFRRSVELAEKHRRAGQAVHYTLQTNGTLLDDEWGAFLGQHDFLVGISLDGPGELHDAYRVDKGGQPTFERVMRGLDVLRRHGVEWNILCTVHAANGDHPLEVYRFFRDELGAQFIQFIPIVERAGGTGSRVSDRSVRPKQFGAFLIDVFDEWVRWDVGRVYVQYFDAALAAWAGAPQAMCVLAPTCGGALALEHNGDLYSCDHYVEPGHRLGNIMERPMAELVASEEQRRFGLEKRDGLPRYCRRCAVRFACHGECPRNRFAKAPDGEPGLNYLCPGYKAFFSHVDGPMRVMAELLRQGRAPAEVMGMRLPSGQAGRA